MFYPFPLSFFFFGIICLGYKLALLFFSIVEFATYSDMKNALDKLDDTEINGRRIRLIEDRPRKRRRRYLFFASLALFAVIL